MSEVSVLDVRVPAEIIHNWGWFVLVGIGRMVLGIAAIVRSVAATVVSMLFFGWLLLIAAAIEIGRIHATQFHPEKSQLWGLRMLENFAAVVKSGR